jgi:hypothetical protein
MHVGLVAQSSHQLIATLNKRTGHKSRSQATSAGAQTPCGALIPPAFQLGSFAKAAMRSWESPYFITLAGARRQMADRDWEFEFVGQFADSGDCGHGFRLNAAMRSDRRRPPVPTKAAGVSLPA